MPSGAGGNFGELGRFEIPIDVALEKLIGDLSKAARAYNLTVDLMLRKTNALASGSIDTQKQFGNLAAANLRQIKDVEKSAQRAAREISQVYDRVARGSALPRVTAQQLAFNRAVGGGVAAAGQQAATLGVVASQFKGYVGYIAGAYVAYKALNSVTLDAARAHIEFESSFAGVRKTVSATEDQYAALESQIRAVAKSRPVESVNQLNAIASAAGQLGIARENVINFTKTISELAITTDLAAEEGATSLAQWANITRLPQNQIRNLASAIVHLGNTSATTERRIVDMGLRLAGAGRQIGLTDAQIAGLATAMASLGIETESGGTAFSRIMIEIAQAVANATPQVELFAALAGMTGEAFREMFKADPGEAIVKVVEGMGRLSDAGGNLFGVLEELELADIRVRDALLRASGAGDILRDSMDKGTEAFKENTALAKEADERYKTLESRIQVLKNTFGDLQIAIGDTFSPATLAGVNFAIELINTLTGAVSELNKELGLTGNRFKGDGNPLVNRQEMIRASQAIESGQITFGAPAEPIGPESRGFGTGGTNPFAGLDLGAFGDLEEVAADAANITDDVEAAAAAADEFKNNVEKAIEGIGKAGEKGSKAAESAAKRAQREMERMQKAADALLKQEQNRIDDLFERARGMVESAIPLEALGGRIREIGDLFNEVPEGFGNSLDAVLQQAIQQYTDAGGKITDGVIQSVIDRTPELAEAIAAAMQEVQIKLADESLMALMAKDDEKLLEQLERQFTPTIDMIAMVNNELAYMGSQLQSIGRNGESGLERIAGGAGTVIAAITSVIGTYVAMEAAAVAAAGTAAAAWFAILGPIALVIAAVQAAVSVFGLFGDETEDELSRTEQLIEDVGQAFDDFLSDLTDAIVEFVKTGEFNFNKLLEGLLEDLLQIGVDATITDPIRGALGLDTKSAAANVSTIPKDYGQTDSLLTDADLKALAGYGRGAPIEINVYNDSGGAADVDVQQRTRGDGTTVIDAFVFSSVKRQTDSGRLDPVLGRNYQGIRRTLRKRSR